MSEQTSIVSILRAMALNYGKRGHSWDHLDGEAVTKAADQIDALHTEAEALRAELEERYTADEHQRLVAIGQKINVTYIGRLEERLEAARGLLRDLDEWFDNNDASPGYDIETRMAQLLTATPPPEAPDHLRDSAKMVEQGERHDVWARQCDLEESDPALFVARERVEESGYTVRLTTTPQPGPDVRGLVEALEHARLFIRNGVELGYVKMPDADTPDPAHDTLPKIEAALAAHRQAQRQA